MKCPFCDLDSQSTRTIVKGTLASAILSNPRLVAGHTLVVPHRHIDEPGELSQQELIEIFTIINDVRNKMLKSFATGCDIRQNFRPFIKEGWTKVDHVHFHVIPRTNEDKLFEKSMRFEKDLFKNLSETERQIYLKKFS